MSVASREGDWEYYVNSRAHEIDGIRGWAAVCVLFYHLLYETFGAILPATRSVFIFAALNGPLAVMIFFTLSGDALSIAYLRGGKRSTLDSLLVRRYPRLAIPVVLSCAAVFLLMTNGMIFNRPAAEIVRSRDWLGKFLDFNPSIESYLRYVLVDVFSLVKRYDDPARQYNPMLWTMAIELTGSVFVFLFWYLSDGLRRVNVTLLAAAATLAALNSYYALFFLGMLFSRLRQAGIFERFRMHVAWQYLAPCLIVLAALLDASFEPDHRRIGLVSAGLIVFCCYTSRPLLVIFRSRLSRRLAEISFPLYLTHFAVIVSFTSWCIVRAGSVTPELALQLSAASAALALAVAAIFRLAEKNLLAAADNRLARLLAKPESAPR